jgi:lysophospholipase L1-like esterase
VRRKRAARLALLGAASLAALSIGEVGARKLYGSGFASVVDVYEHHPHRPYVRYRDTAGVEVVTNGLGWKDASARPVAKQPADTRVVVLGDSFVEGVGLADGQTIPRLLERELRGRGRDVEVLNGGRVSFSPLLEYQRLKRFLAAGYRTQHVVVLPDISDVQDEIAYAGQFSYSADGEPLQLKGAIANPLLRATYNELALLRTLRRVQLELTGAPSAGQLPARSSPAERRRAQSELAAIPAGAALDDHRTLSEATQRVLRANWMVHPPSLQGWAGRGLGLLATNLRRIAALCDRQGIALLVVVYPWPQMLLGGDDEARYGALRRRFGPWLLEREILAEPVGASLPTPYEASVLGACEKTRARCLSVVDEFAAQPRWERLFQPGDVHFNDRGNALVARAIARAMGAP